MTETTRRAPIVLFLVATLAALLAMASPASAAPLIPIDYRVDATTTIASVGQTVTTTGGRFTGSVDLGTGAITGNLSLPPGSSTFSIAGIGLATATFAVQPTGPITGTVNLATMTATTTSSFNIRITSLRPTFLPWWNLVGSYCRTATPISVTMSGPISLTEAAAMSGTFTMPRLRDCGFLTGILNLLIPGPGNTFSATFRPAVV